MTEKEFKQKELAYLKSSKRELNERGKALSLIHDFINKNGQPKLGFTQEIQVAARKAYDIYTNEYDLTGSPDLAQRKKQCQDLIQQWTPLSKEKTIDVLNSLSDTSFEGIRKILKDDPVLELLDPQLITEIIEESTSAKSESSSQEEDQTIATDVQ